MVTMVEGGAVQSEVQLLDVAAVPEDEDTIAVVTTAPGTLGPGGVVPVGTAIPAMPMRLVSDKWMRPKTQASAKKLEAWRNKGSDQT